MKVALRRTLLVSLLLALLVAGLAVWMAACTPEEDSGGSTSSSTDSVSSPPGDADAIVGDEVEVDDAVITVRGLQATFNPVMPEQRLSEQAPSSPDGNESFYQAYVKVENHGVRPIRVDPRDFACAVGNTVVGIEDTWSGPAARSLLKNGSLDLLVTFKAQAGYDPVLLYSPSWYVGTIRIRPASAATSTTQRP
jgi:hypothetical protein